MDNVTDTLNVNRIGQIDQYVEACMHVVMSYFAAPNSQEPIPDIRLVKQCIWYIQRANPQLIQTMLEQYVANPRTLRQFVQLMPQPAQLIPPNQPNQPDPAWFDYACGLYGRFYIGKVKISVGPQFRCQIPFANSNMGLKFNLFLGQANKGRKKGLGGFFSVSKKECKATATVETDLSRENQERTFTFQKNVSDNVKIGVKAKDNCPEGVFPLAPSHLIRNSNFVVSHNIKLDGYEIETTVGHLPVEMIKDRIRQNSRSRHKNQISNNPTLTETRAAKHEMLILETPVPSYRLRSQEAIVKLSILGLLVALCLFLVSKLVGFLKTRKIV